MPPERQAAPAAFEANDIIRVNRSPDRHGGGPLSLGFGSRFSESRERLMDGRNQCPELIGPDFVSPNVRGDDVGREFSTDGYGRQLLGHLSSPCRTTDTHLAQNIEAV